MCGLACVLESLSEEEEPIRAGEIAVRALLVLVCMLACARPAAAITYDEIPDDVLDVLPQFIFQLIDPQALAYLTAEDLREYADAYDEGRMHFIADVRVVEHTGTLDPDLAVLILQVPQGAPYIEERFLRLAKQAYSRQIFSSLSWQVWENKDGSVNIDIRYTSQNPQNWVPEPSYTSLAGGLVGVRYNDFFFDNSNKQLSASLGVATKEADDPYGSFSFTDNTLNGGRNSESYSASVANTWRTRKRDTIGEVAEIRTRVSRVDYAYGFNGEAPLGRLPGSWGVGAGIFRHEAWVYAGNPNGSGVAPRGDFSPTGNGVETYITWSSGERDSTFLPKKGWSYSARASKTFGNFDSQRFRLDLRRYIPVHNIAGPQVRTELEPGIGVENDIRDFFDTASLSVQLQADLADGKVPWASELIAGGAGNVRGYTYDTYAATKFVGARAEYRCTLDKSRNYEAYVFSDNGFIGETLDDMESLNSWGVGGLFKLPIYGGFKVGGWIGQAWDGSDNSWGLAFGSQF
ncbi:hypothetical protein KDL29_10760 [bacterium]|nr:hypothetical protein [bacterium]